MERPTDPGTPCIVCHRRPATAGRLCWPDRDRLAAHLDPNHAGSPFRGDDPTAPVRPPSIPRLYATLADLQPDAGERDHEHADAAQFNAHHASLRDARSKATGPGRDDDGEHGPRSVLATLGGWVRIAHEEHLDLNGRRAPLPSLGAPPHTRAPHTRLRWVGGRAQPMPRPDIVAVETLCRWLWQRCDWLTEQPWCDELVTDLRDLTAALNAARGDPGRRPLGACPALLDIHGQPAATGTRCGEPLFMPETGPREPGAPLDPPTVRCTACGSSRTGVQLIEFARDNSIPITT